MLVRRCGWHRMYFGYPLINGVAAWRGCGLGIKVTDGICRRCAARVHAELRALERTRPAPTSRAA
ncbi:MAG TPA: hypothetical protein VGL09_07205 [Methylomirabilota bacterium]|jgi:hypothetical protein